MHLEHWISWYGLLIAKVLQANLVLGVIVWIFVQWIFRVSMITCSVIFQLDWVNEMCFCVELCQIYLNGMCRVENNSNFQGRLLGSNTWWGKTGAILENPKEGRWVKDPMLPTAGVVWKIQCFSLKKKEVWWKIDAFIVINVWWIENELVMNFQRILEWPPLD